MKTFVFAITVLFAAVSSAAVCSISQFSGRISEPTAAVSGDNGVAVSASCTESKDSKTVKVKETFLKQFPVAHYPYYSPLELDATAQSQNVAAAWAEISQDLINKGYTPVSSTLFKK